MNLRAVMDLQSRINVLEEKLQCLKSKAESPHVTKLDGLPHAQGGTTSRTESLAEQIICAERELSSLRETQIENQLELMLALFRHVKETRVFDVMILRYVELKSFDEIAAQMDYSERRIYQWHKQGLNILKTSGEFCGV